MDNDTHNNILDVTNLNVTFHSSRADVNAVRNSSFSLKKKQSLGIVGESGSGKSVSSLALLGLYRDSPLVSSTGSIEINLGDKTIRLDKLDDAALQKIRGLGIGLVLQEPGSSLNPAIKCGKQLEEVLRTHNIPAEIPYRETVLRTLRQVSLEDEERIYHSYPHELSGGQLQRVCIAMAIIAKPQILICDEATSALDLTTQKEILDLLKKLRQELGLSIILISHDLNVVAEICDRVIIMKNGLIVEEGDSKTIFSQPQHSYTQELLSNRPSLMKRNTLSKSNKKGNKVLDIRGLTHQYKRKRIGLFSPQKYDTVLDNITFSLNKAEILGIVGESGSGKSTIAKALVGMIKPTSGKLSFTLNDGTSKNLDERSMRAIQLIFQDPYSSLNPSMSIGRSLYELIAYYKLTPKSHIKERAIFLLDRVGLSEAYYNRLPNELSGGQRQRVCIAKALSLEPNILICDECVSALDVTIQAQVLELLLKLRQEMQLSMIFIGHDLAVINMLCDRVLVLHKGKIVESGTPYEIIHSPSNSHTKKLLLSIPSSVGFSSK